MERYPALGSGPLEPGSYLVAFDVPPGDVLHGEAVRMDATEDQVAFAPPWKSLETYWIRDNFDDTVTLEHDVAPGRCTSCYVAGWAPSGSGVAVQLMGLEGIRVRDDVLHYERSRARAIVQERRGDEWRGREVPVELLPDELPPELRLRRPSGPLLPWSSLSIEASEPLASEHLEVRVGDGDLEAISPATPRSRGTLISPELADPEQRWWPLGSKARIDYEAGAVDHAGNERDPDAWAVDVVPSVATRPIGDTGGLVHWGELEFDRGEHRHLASAEGLGLFGMLRLDTDAVTVSARVSICGAPGRRVLCTASWARPGEPARESSVEMTVDRLPTEDGCFAPSQVIQLASSPGAPITGEVGVAARFEDPDGSPLEDVQVVVHTIWPGNDIDRGGS